jgi:hypothetical protein
MAQGITEVYTILVQTAGANADVRALVKELDQSNRALQQTQKAAGGAAAATGNLSKAQKQAALQFQNAGYQVQDFLVQVSAGTGAMRALGQQLPQLLSGFGLWGVALGTLAAGLGAVAPLLLGTSQKAATAAEQLDVYRQAIDAVRESTAQSLKPMEEFEAQFGIFGQQAKALSEIKIDIDTQQARDQANALIKTLQETEIAQSGMLERYKRGQAALTRAQQDRLSWTPDSDQSIAQLETMIERAEKGLADLRTEVDQTTGFSVEQFDMVSQSIQEMTDAMNAGDFSAATKAAEEVRTSLDNATGDFGVKLRAQFEDLVNSVLALSEGANAGIADILQTAYASFQAGQSEIDKMDAAIAAVEAQIERAKDAAAEGLIKPEVITLLNQQLDRMKAGLRDIEDASQNIGKPFELLQPTIDSAMQHVEGLRSEEQKAADEARVLAQVLAIVEANAGAIPVEQVEALRRALADAEYAASGAAAQVRALSSAVNSIRSGNISTAISNVSKLAELEALRANKTEEEARMIGTLAGAQERLNMARAEAPDIYGPTGAEYEYNQAVELAQTQLKLDQERTKIIEGRAAAEKAASGAAKKGASEASKAAKDAERDFKSFQKTLQSFETDQQKATREMAELRAERERFGKAMTADDIRNFNQAMAELAEQAKASAVELSEIGEIFDDSLNSFFGDLVEGSKTASEAFNDFILSMINSITTFLFSKQVEAFLGYLSQATGFGFLSTGGGTTAPTANVNAAPSANTFAATAAAPAVGARGLGSGYSYVVPAAPIASATGSGLYAVPNVVINNYSTAEVSARQSQDSNGDPVLEIAIKEKVRELVTSGALDPQMQRAYGLRRKQG